MSMCRAAWEKGMTATAKVLDVPIDGPPVSQTPTLEHSCEVSGFRAVALPPGDVELAVQPRWHAVNIMPTTCRLDLLKVAGEDLTHLPPVPESMSWMPRGADLRIVCENLGWELILELDPDRTEALADETLGGRPLSEEFVYWRRDAVAVAAASLLIEHLRQPVVDRLYAEGLILATAARALRFAAGVTDEPSTRGTDGRLLRVVDYIHANLDASVAMADLATVAGMSPWQFARAFKAETGQSPHQYVLERRVDYARELLAFDDMPLAQVAAASGFASQSHMTDVFRVRLGVSPGRYRRQTKT